MQPHAVAGKGAGPSSEPRLPGPAATARAEAQAAPRVCSSRPRASESGTASGTLYSQPRRGLQGLWLPETSPGFRRSRFLQSRYKMTGGVIFPHCQFILWPCLMLSHQVFFERCAPGHFASSGDSLKQQFSTGVLGHTDVQREFLKCAKPDYFMRGTDLFSLRLSNKINDNSQHDNIRPM